MDDGVCVWRHGVDRVVVSGVDYKAPTRKQMAGKRCSGIIRGFQVPSVGLQEAI